MSAPVSGVDYYVLTVGQHRELSQSGYFGTFLGYFSQTDVGGYYYQLNPNDPAVETAIWDVLDVFPDMTIGQMRYVRSTQSWTGV